MLSELKILYHRDHLARIVLAETIIIAVLSFLLFCGKDSVTYASAYDHNFMINDNTAGISMIIILLLPLIACLATGDIMTADLGIRDQIIVLKGRKEYFRSKMIVVFLTSFVNTFFIFELLNLCLLSSIDLSGRFYIAAEYSPIVSYSISTYNPFLLRHPFLFSHTLFALLSLFAASCACLSQAIGNISGLKILYYIGAFVLIVPINLLFALTRGNLTYNMGFSSFIQNLSGKPQCYSLFIIFSWIVIPLFISFVIQKYVENKT